MTLLQIKTNFPLCLPCISSCQPVISARSTIYGSSHVLHCSQRSWKCKTFSHLAIFLSLNMEHTCMVQQKKACLFNNLQIFSIYMQYINRIENRLFLSYVWMLYFTVQILWMSDFLSTGRMKWQKASTALMSSVRFCLSLPPCWPPCWVQINSINEAITKGTLPWCFPVKKKGLVITNQTRQIHPS